MDQIAEIKRLSVAFQTSAGSLTAVDQIDFNLNPGETLALLGESGCGKSLTSLALIRLLPIHTLYGQQSEILLNGQDILELPEYIMRSFRGRRLAMIFQEPMTALNPVLSIGEQLAEALQEHQSLHGKELKQRMLALLEEVEMPQPEQRLQQYPHQLSGGQKQRVVIAMALASKPQILIADEPTTALDVTIQAQILSLLKKLQRQHQMSLLLITHDLGVVKAMADRVCVMYAGHLVEIAAVDDFFMQPLHPYSQQLLVSLPTFAKRGLQLQAIAGVVPSIDNIPSGCRFHPRCAHVFTPCANVQPQLQTAGESRLVRCHLYPEHSSPPPIAYKAHPWLPNIEQGKIVLSVNNLQVIFKSSHKLFSKQECFKAVDDVSFELHSGRTLALVGESGCGKTTIAKSILRLQPYHSGTIFYHQREVHSLKGQALREFRKNVQIIFQDPFSSMNPRMTIGEILAEGMQAQGLGSKAIRSKQYQILDQVNLAKNSLHRYPHQFSGGQRQRICIARALATEPDVLICDEPTSALDISVQAQILNLLKRLQQEYGLAYLFITHNMGVVSYIADDVLVMKEGKVVERGSCSEILHNPTHSYTRHLLAGVLEV
jgi:oligopeptide/dipeptide ABC transporter ATP-binding protein